MSSAHASSLPIFWGHGTADPLITFKIGSASVDYLQTCLGFSAAPRDSRDAPDAEALKGVMFKGYSGLQHGVAPEELVDLREWFKKILPNN